MRPRCALLLVAIPLIAIMLWGSGPLLLRLVIISAATGALGGATAWAILDARGRSA